MNPQIFINGVQSFANLLAFSPDKGVPADFFCRRLKSLHSVQDGTYNHNYDPPVGRVCPLPECGQIHVDLGKISELDQVGQPDPRMGDDLLIRLQRYATRPLRNDHELIETALAHLCARQLDLCKRIENGLARGTVPRQEYSACQQEANQILAIFKLIMQTDARAWGIKSELLRLTRILPPYGI